MNTPFQGTTSNEGVAQAGNSGSQRVSQKLFSSIDSSDEEYYDIDSGPSIDSVNVEDKPSSSKGARFSTCSESDSDLESIPTVSYFKQHAWKGSESVTVNQSNFNGRNGIKSLSESGEYIEGKWENNQLMEVFSFQFIHPDNSNTVYVRKQNAGYLFTFDEEDFIARVHFNKLEKQSFVKPFTVDVKRNILECLTVIEIIKDKLLNDRNTAYEQFKQLLQNRNSITADYLEYAEDFFQLSKSVENWGTFRDNIFILANIAKNENVSHKMNNIIRQLLHKEIALKERKTKFAEVRQFYAKDLVTELQEICKEVINDHRNTLYEKYFRTIFMMAPCIMVDYLSDLDHKSVFYISNKDIELFADLVDMMRKEPFLDLVSDAWDALFKRVEEIRKDRQLSSSLRNFAPLTHPIYFYLCKSFQELILEISGKTDIRANDLLKINKKGKWSSINNINWPSPSLLNDSLEKQYKFIFKLMEHFKPGYYSNNTKFKYKLEFLQDIADKTLLQCKDDRLVWIYVLDKATAQLFLKESKRCLELFNHLLKGYTSFIQEAKDTYYESFRVVTHNVIRFIVQTTPYLSKGISEIILTKQMESIKKAFLDRQSDDFRDLIDVYNEYWKKKESILEKIPNKFPHGKFKRDMKDIQTKLFNITITVLDKKAKLQDLIKYFRVFNEFLEDLNSIEFKWFVKKINDSTVYMELVNTTKESYRVSDPENFIKNHKTVPKHYLIDIIQDLLNCVSDLLMQNKWSDDNLNAASELLSAIKKSFLYLKEQPTYVSFDTFKEETTEPFISVIKNSSSYDDFEKRIGIIEESFWYLRKQDEINIEEAFKLYRKEANDLTTEREEILRDCYSRYLRKFTSYIQENISKNYQDKIESITEQVKMQAQQIKIHEWDITFKKKTLPDLLAGLAAVWSIQKSKDIANKEKYLKPHCIQILCILRLLSVDSQSKGVAKHLAQVLTGQGKSLVLGLLSSLLALTGCRIRTVCYSKYLTTRDQQDFDDFFRLFNIRDKIIYGTFVDMANEILEPEVNGKKQGLRKLIKNRVLNRSAEQTGKINQEEGETNTILLIDEVDVFFSDKCYGNTYSACETITIPALGTIQEKIWEMAIKNYEKSVILEEVKEFVAKKISERNEDFKQFNKFLYKLGNYCLLKKEDNVIVKKEYNNQSLYKEHLDIMIDNAIEVAKGSDQDWYINRYKINSDGIISYKDRNGIYCTSTYSEYYNVFNYFRLKKIDFVSKNYGYLNIHSGRVSYAELPKNYPLILGVSGTLTTLNDHERKAVEKYYKINERSVMPSFFGRSNLKFNESYNFTSQDSEEEWFSEIFSHANSKIDSGQSVLIFFDSDIEINKFNDKFHGKFYRMHVLTENTNDQTKKKYIDEAGITKTVTLATKGMGRGVDFKSSIAVEKYGGVHVIQTFFSLDIKEETQIKGRTARKDNQGSYELIVCKKHLINAGFPEDITVNYESLNISRKEQIKEKGLDIEQKIERSESDHKVTMDFLKSFFL